ncbi:MAG: potassium channel protein [Nitrospinae bacterium]|nr:potassium channel protein [Nitrospinota bacterium]
MVNNLYLQIYKRFALAGMAIVTVLLIGTLGYKFIGGERYTLIDCLYMTVITVATIGYGEIVDMSASPGGRVFTMFIALFGIGIMTYIFSNFTAYVVEGELNEAFRRMKMEKMVKGLKGHYIVCGIEGVGLNIVKELHETGRPHVIVDIDKNKINKLLEEIRNEIFIEGDATDGDSLLKAGIKDANGLFAVTGNDNQNLVISLTAKQINPNIKVVVRCHDIKNMEKMKLAGADSVVSPTLIGGMRMASEMIRPMVVSFLDVMLRDKEKNLRIEEVSAPQSFTETTIASLNIKKLPNVLLLAVRTKGDWIYNPPDNYLVKPENTLIFMTTPDGRDNLKKIFAS